MRKLNLLLLVLVFINLTACASSPFAKIENAMSYKSNTNLPIDGNWTIDNNSMALEYGVLYYISNPNIDYINKAIIVNIDSDGTGIYKGKCFNYKDKSYNLTCKLELYKPNLLGVFYNGELLYKLSLNAASDKDRFKSEADASIKTASILNKYTQCSDKCQSVHDKCDKLCFTKSLSKLSLDQNRNNMLKLEYSLCSNECSSNKSSCVSDCSSILD